MADGDELDANNESTPMIDREALEARIADLERRSVRDRAAVERLTTEEVWSLDPHHYLRDGAGPAVWLYVEGRTGGRLYEFSPDQFARLERAMNRWLECFARCHGVDLEAEFTLREAAELLLETRNIHDVGELLTGVPPDG